MSLSSRPNHSFPISHVSVSIIHAIQVGTEAPIVPPSTLVEVCTVLVQVFVIVLVKGAEVHFVGLKAILWLPKCVTCIALIPSCEYFVVLAFTENLEVGVLGIVAGAVEGSELHVQLRRATPVRILCQAVHVLQPQPELAIEVTESQGILRPGAVEALCTIHAPLKSGVTLATAEAAERVKRPLSIWVNDIDAWLQGGAATVTSLLSNLRAVARDV